MARNIGAYQNGAGPDIGAYEAAAAAGPTTSEKMKPRRTALIGWGVSKMARRGRTRG